ncbi:hypothetical protein [Brevibacterium litoralis]|uniref:hypothetical protein n=1 Tax=Brevibacterium litoralis TaxID=3138935 RepID=UPI0032F04861
MYQLYRSVPVVWRSARCLQLGIDDPALIDGLAPADTELVSLVRMGIEVEDFFDRAEKLGVDASRAASLLAILDEAGALVPLDTEEATRPDPLPTAHTDAWAARAHTSPARVSARLAARTVYVTGPFRDDLAVLLTAAGLVTRVVDRVEDVPDDPGVLVVLTAVWAADAVAAGFLAEAGREHLHVVVGQSRAEISHVVVPARTPCTRCAFHHRGTEDPDWMVAWRSVWREQPAAGRTDPVLAHLALGHAAEAVRSHVVHPREVPTDLEVALPHGAVTELVAAFHPSCDCRLPMTHIDDRTDLSA